MVVRKPEFAHALHSWIRYRRNQGDTLRLGDGAGRVGPVQLKTNRGIARPFDGGRHAHSRPGQDPHGVPELTVCAEADESPEEDFPDIEPGETLYTEPAGTLYINDGASKPPTSFKASDRDATPAGPQQHEDLPAPKQRITRSGPVSTPAEVDLVGELNVSRRSRSVHPGDLTGDAPSVAAGRQEKDSVHIDASDYTGSELVTQAEIETHFGGIFYLINLAIFLELYGDFTSPLRPGIELNIWDFLAFVGRRLAGAKIEADPVWQLLVQLAGRSKEQYPGVGFEPPDEWRLPPDWLKPFSKESTWVWSSRAGRLQLKHPAGFLVVDIPLDVRDPVHQLEQESSRYREAAVLELVNEDVPGVYEMSRLGYDADTRQAERWLDRLMPYITARLRRALGLGDEHQVSRMVSCHDARVTVTPVHLDVFLSLTDLPIEIRIAGLDRDPGWVPAAGRFITFHFE
jgi:hypothetical protein